MSIAKSVSSVERRRMGFFPGGMVFATILVRLGLFGKERKESGWSALLGVVKKTLKCSTPDATRSHSRMTYITLVPTSFLEVRSRKLTQHLVSLLGVGAATNCQGPISVSTTRGKTMAPVRKDSSNLKRKCSTVPNQQHKGRHRLSAWNRG